MENRYGSDGTNELAHSNENEKKMILLGLYNWPTQTWAGRPK